MTVYLCHIIIPNNKFYNLVNIIPSNLIMGDYYRYGLFAFTKKKKYMKEFKKYHNSEYFRYSEKEMDKEEYDELSHTKRGMKINLFSIKNGNNKCKIFITHLENEILSYDSNQIFFEMLDKILIINPEILSIDYYNILKKVGYTGDYIERYGDEDEIDYFWYNQSYGIYPDTLDNKFKEATDFIKFIIIYSPLIDSLELVNYLIEKKR